MSIEVEVKIRINETDFEILKKWLTTHATLIGNQKQLDTYFEPTEKSYVYMDNGIRKADKWLRVREESDNSSICFKLWHRDKGITLFADEYEVKVENPETMKSLIKALKYKQLIKVEKNRESWTYENIEISIDLVDDLGVFVELEYKRSSTENAILDKQKLYDLLKKVGINNYVEDNLGYPAKLLNI